MATSEAPPGVVAASTQGLMTASDAMVAAGREMVQAAGGADRQIPPLPDDRHGLVMLIVQFDEARERYERRIGERFESAGATVALQAIDTMDADAIAGLDHVPAAGR
jgi:hypothetical protein